MTEKTTRRLKKAADGNNVVARMNNALHAEYDTIKRLVSEVDRQDVHARYEIATRCQKVREGDGKGGAYGERAVARLARALGWSKSAVYEYANVAVTWPSKKEFTELAAKVDRFDKPLGWSRIVQLANVATVESRDTLIADALKHGWNVRDLRKNLRAGTAEEDDATPAAKPQPKVPCVLDAAVQNYVTQVAALTSNAAAFGKHFVEQIEEADPADLTDAVVDRLEQAREDLRELLTQADRCIEEVQQRRRTAIGPQDDRDGPAADQRQNGFCEEPQEQPEEALIDAT